ncbi:MAG: hypothetical protein ACK5BL_03930, partial [Flavobacteriales bacterium]
MNAIPVKGIVRTAVVLACLMVGNGAFAQCLVINEIMINAAGDCDGSCAPESAEWIELYNTCATAVDASCFVLTDGDFAVTLPPGTFIASN